MPSSWLERGDRPRSVEQLGAMSWADFETLALEIVGRLYASDGIILRRTGAGHDGGRDAEATLRFGSIAEHALSLTLWVEVKQHRRSVGRQQVGGHIFAAISASANIIVIVSCSGFSKNFRSDIDRFSQRTGIRNQLISGQQLLAIADRLLGDAPGSVAAAPIGPAAEPKLRLTALRLSATPSLREGASTRSIPVALGTPFFAIIQFEYQSVGRCRDIEVNLTSSNPAIVPFPITPTHIRLAGPLEQISSVYLLRASAATTLLPKDLALRVRILGWTDEGGRAELVAATTSARAEREPRVRFIRAAIPYVPTRAQEEIAREIERDCRRWQHDGGLVSLSIEAAAGVGKSALLSACRWSWLGAGAREILLDGETEATVWDVFFAVFAHTIPVDGGLLSTGNIAPFAKWLEGVGASSELALRLARAICEKGKSASGFSPGELENLLVVLLRRLSASGPVALVFEDLHKVGGSVLRLLHSACRALAGDPGARILFCLTSRFAPQVVNDEGEAWSLERKRLLGREGARRYRLDIPPREDAEAILHATIDHLYPEMAHDMVERAGRTPFGLSELIRYLEEADILVRPEAGGRLTPNPGADFRLALKDPALLRSTATERRLFLLSDRLPNWACELLDLAACVGREFALERLTASIADAPTDAREIDSVLGHLVQNGILDATTRSAVYDWRFEHDLIREAILQRLADPQHRPRHRRMVRRLLSDEPRCPEPVRLSLLYQSGEGDAFVAEARSHATSLGAAGYPYEAASYLALESAVLDPTEPISSADDPVFRVVTRPVTSLRASLDTLIDVKRRLFEMLYRVSGGAGETAARLITDVRMLAAKANNLGAAALSEHWHGNLSIATGDPAQAVACFRDAQELYANLPGEHRKELFEASLGEAVALRLLGQTEASAAELARALALDPDDPHSQVRFHANYGALFFYTDPALRREHWSVALSIAEAARLDDLAVHMGLDLASLDIIDRHFTDARERLGRLAAIATERRYENSLMRALVMTSCLDLIDGAPEAALTCLDEARRLGYAHDVGRRLWKVHANSACAHEMLGDPDRAYHEDRHAVAVLKAVAWERRIGLAPANLLLRSQGEAGSPRYSALAAAIPAEARGAVNAILAAVDSKTPLCGRFPQEHLFMLDGRMRFVAT